MSLSLVFFNHFLVGGKVSGIETSTKRVSSMYGEIVNWCRSRSTEKGTLVIFVKSLGPGDRPFEKHVYW